MEIDYIWGPNVPGIFGISRQSYELQTRIPQVTFKNISCPWLPNPYLGGILNRICLPLNSFRQSKKGHIKHIASQGYAFTTPFLRKGPVILTCNDLIPWTFYNNRGHLWRANIRFIRQIEHIISISEYTKNELLDQLKIPEERIHHIPCGVDHQKFHPITNPIRPAYLNPEDKILLYVGSEERRKNIGVILRAMKDLIKIMPNVKLIKGAGPGPGISPEICINEIDRLGISKHVIFTGTLSDTELRSLYNIADVFVFPSLCEGFGLPILEAMACGCPVITSNSSSIPEVVGDAGILLNPEDPKAWCAAMFTVLNDPGMRENMRQKSLRQAEKFSWDKCARKTYELYCEVGSNL